jgi:hypothetical protein
VGQDKGGADVTIPNSWRRLDGYPVFGLPEARLSVGANAPPLLRFACACGSRTVARHADAETLRGWVVAWPDAQVDGMAVKATCNVCAPQPAKPTPNHVPVMTVDREALRQLDELELLHRDGQIQEPGDLPTHYRFWCRDDDPQRDKYMDRKQRNYHDCYMRHKMSVNEARNKRRRHAKLKAASSASPLGDVDR